MQEKELAKTSAFPLGKKNDAYAKYFIGQSYLSMLNDKECFIANVTFEPKCRNNWHIHHGAGQILVCVGGHGWYQEFGQKPRHLAPGDVVYIAPEVKHWHGAVASEAFAHLSLSVPKEGATNEWLEPITDAEYAKLPPK